MQNNYVIPEEDLKILEEKWKKMSPEEKASVIYPDMTTKPLTDVEREHLKHLFEDDLQNG
jgi:hypothetical protein